MTDIRAPFPAFGGKSRAVEIVWPRFGRPVNYCEPFCFSAAMLLGCPEHQRPRVETANDVNHFVVNFWRAVAADAEAVAAGSGIDSDAAIYALDALKTAGDLTFHRSTDTRPAGYSASPQARARTLPDPVLPPASGLDDRTPMTRDNVHDLLGALLRRQRGEV